MKLISVKFTKKQKIIYITLGVLAIILIAIGVAMSQVKPPDITSPTITTTKDDVTGEVVEDVVESTKTGDIYTFLFAGRDASGYNTDTLMVASFNTIDYTVSILSIPRDTMSNDTSRAVAKINAAYSVGGSANPENLVKEVEQFLGFEIDRYAVINLDVFVKLVDLIGGVTIDVPRNMYYSDPSQGLYIDLDAGVQTLDGEEAMGFVRYRSGYTNGDLGRIEAQQLFIQALAESALKPSIITKISTIISTVFDNLDTDFTITELVWLATEALNIDLENGITITTLPGRDGAAYSSATDTNLSYYFADLDDLLELLNESFNPTSNEITAEDLNIAIQSEQYVKPAEVETEEAEGTDETEESEENDDQASDNTGTSTGVKDPEASDTTDDTNGSAGATTDPGTDDGSDDASGSVEDTETGGDTTTDTETGGEVTDNTTDDSSNDVTTVVPEVPEVPETPETPETPPETTTTPSVLEDPEG